MAIDATFIDAVRLNFRNRGYINTIEATYIDAVRMY